MPGNGQNFWGWYPGYWYMTNSSINYSHKSKAHLGKAKECVWDGYLNNNKQLR